MADDHRGLQRAGTGLIGIAVCAVIAALVFGLLGDHNSGPGNSPSPTATAPTTASATPSPSQSASPASFVSADGQDLILDGEQFRYAGANAYTLIFSDPAIVDLYMKTAADAHFAVMRTWGFTDIGTTDG